ncbi:MAG: AMP-binding protein [Eggerthellaceae bacterium]
MNALADGNLEACLKPNRRVAVLHDHEGVRRHHGEICPLNPAKVRRYGPVQRSGTVLGERSAHPDKTAVVFDGREITYRAMNDRINQMAGVLTCDLGVRPGDRVAYLLPNCPELLELYYAVQKIGAVAVPLNYKLIPREVAYLVNASGAEVLVFASQFAASVAEAAQSFTSDVALVSAGGECPAR